MNVLVPLKRRRRVAQRKRWMQIGGESDWQESASINA